MAARRPTKGPISPATRGRIPDEADHAFEPPRRLFAPLPDVTAQETEVERLRAQVEELGIVVERLRARALASQREAVLLSEHLTTRGALLGAIRVESESLRHELERARDERELTGIERDTLALDLETARTEVAALRIDVGERTAASDALAAEIADMRAELVAAQEMGAELMASAAALTTDLDTERETSSSLRAELAAALEEVAWHLSETQKAQEAAQDAVRRAAQSEGSLATASASPAPPAAASLAPPPAPPDGSIAEDSDRAAWDEALERARADTLELADRLAATEAARDAYRGYLKAVATTTPGRVAQAWSRFSRRHPRAARLIRTPFTGAWMLVTLRWPWWLRQHPLFDRDWYLEVNRDVRDARLKPWWHYVRHGIREGRAPNRYFDRQWYLRTYPDVKLSGMEPLDHYYRFGAWERRDPSPRFMTEWYMDQHPEIVANGMNPLSHFLRWGVQNGFQPRPSGTARRRAYPQGVGSEALSAPSATGWTPPVALAPSPRPGSDLPRPMRAPDIDVGKVKRALRGVLPDGARVGIVSDGHRDLLDLPNVDVVPVPRADDGRPASDVPRNDLSAIAHLEWLRATHIDYLVVPEPSLWMTMVPGLLRHLDGRYAAIGRRGDGATIFDLRAPMTRAAGEDEDVDALLRRARERVGRETSVLDWAAGTVLRSDISGLSVFAPDAGAKARSLPYADGSIDVVLVPDGDAERLAEARRIASTLVVGVRAGTTSTAELVEWIGDGQDGRTSSVSIIIPTWNDATLIAACLRTLDETVADAQVEVIVSDDGSDASFHGALDELVARYERVRLVRSATNGGYIAAASAGAAAASNDVLVFLNNDTILLPGWLEPLIETLRGRPSTGVVGGMLLYPDGRLQEAGCAIFRDGSATKIGFRDSDPTLPYYAYPREVDYVSGALLATPRELFERLGGLDRAFGFGYYEDGDYCFRARREGLDVVYQPRSVVVHVEGGTAGTDLTKGAKRYQATNQALFIERWRAELEQQPIRPEPLDIHASRDLVIRGRPPTAVP